MPKASSLEAKILKSLDADVKLIPGRGGVFVVKVDGKLLYSKKDNDNQFPDEEALVSSLKARKA